MGKHCICLAVSFRFQNRILLFLRSKKHILNCRCVILPQRFTYQCNEKNHFFFDMLQVNIVEQLLIVVFCQSTGMFFLGMPGSFLYCPGLLFIYSNSALFASRMFFFSSSLVILFRSRNVFSCLGWGVIKLFSQRNIVQTLT